MGTTLFLEFNYKYDNGIDNTFASIFLQQSLSFPPMLEYINQPIRDVNSLFINLKCEKKVREDVVVHNTNMGATIIVKVFLTYYSTACSMVMYKL